MNINRQLQSMSSITGLIKKTRQYNDLYNISWKIQLSKQFPKKLPSDFKVVLVNNPCFGFGDIIFCLKIYSYIKEWYNITPVIATTKPEPFVSNGITNLIGLKIPKVAYEECEDLKMMKAYKVDHQGKMTGRISLSKSKFDLILATPWIGTDYAPNHNTIKRIFPYSNRFNTFLFSEYNPSSSHLYDFPTGIGKGLFGMLLTQTQSSEFDYKALLPNPYVMVHLTPDPRVNSHMCLYSFVKYIVKKYATLHPLLDIVIPSHILENKPIFYKIKKYIREKNLYDDLLVIEKNKRHPITLAKRILRFRTDVTPLPYDKYTFLFQKCLPDVLITGDQSVTDIASCCKNYTMFYQLMPWKRSFARNLAKVIGANHIKRASTSCGLEKMALDQKSNLASIAQHHDFRKLAKPKFDAIVLAALGRRSNTIQRTFENIVLSSRKKKTVLGKFMASF